MSNVAEVAGFKPGILKAGADLSGDQFRCVKVASDGDVERSGAGELSAGILQNKPVLEEACEVDFDGVSKAVSGATIANANTKLMSDATGRVIAATSTNHVVAVNLTPSGGANELISVAIIGLKGHILA